MVRIFLSLGSNIRRDENIRSALAELERHFGPLTVSPIYSCPAVGFEGGDFYNLAVAAETDMEPAAVVALLKGMEARHGRSPAEPKFASRTLDIDLLLYDDLVIDLPGLRLPRPEIEFHAFVLAPLADIAGRCRHPVTGLSIGEMWRRFSPKTPRLEAVELAKLGGVEA